MDNANPAPAEKNSVIADLLAKMLEQLSSISPEEKAEVMKEMAEDNAKAAEAKKAADAAKAPKGVAHMVPIPAIRLPDGRMMIPTFMKHVFLSTAPHQIVCGKCNKVVLAGEMATVKQLQDGTEGWRHLSCMGTHIVKG